MNSRVVTTQRPLSARRPASRRQSLSRRSPHSMCPASGAPSSHAASSADYDLFDPIDYVVTDNVMDLRAARHQRRRQERPRAQAAQAATSISAAAGANVNVGGCERDVHERAANRQARLSREAARARQLTRYEKARERIEERERRVQARLAKCPACHWGLFVLTALLAILSVPIVYSASTAIALDHHGNADFFFWRQAGFVAVGLSVFLLASRLSARQARGAVWLMYAVALAGLLAIDFTPLGTDLGSGTRRWLKLGPLPAQQFSELAKIALIGVLADFWSRAARPAQRALWPWLAAAALTAPVVFLVFVQPHLSAACLLALLPFAMAFYADVPFRQFFKVGAVLVVLGAGAFGFVQGHGAQGRATPGLKTYQMERITAHFSGGVKDERGSNYQKLQSQRALMSGGLLGAGPGQSIYKQGHLPAPHTDFILAVIGEEWGLVGALGLLIVYGAMIFFCFHIGHCADTVFEALLCAGVGTLLAIQVMCNAGVVTGVLPVTGMPLPLLSYGGSGLLCTLAGIGLVLGVSRQLGRAAEVGDATETSEAVHALGADDAASDEENSRGYDVMPAKRGVAASRSRSSRGRAGAQRAGAAA